MVEVRVLGYFVAVAEEGSVSRASLRVLVSQPSLSRQLHALERAMGVQLFIRDRGALRLSAAGHEFLPVARDLLHRYATAIATTRYQSGAAPLVLTVAATSTTVIEVIAPFIAHGVLQNIVLLAHEEVPETAYRSIGNGDADLAMTNEPPPPNYASRHVIDFPIYAYVPPDHAWATRTSVEVDELARVPLITSPASGTTKVLRLMKDLGLAHTVSYEATVPQVALALAAAGHGVAVLSDDPRFNLRALRVVGPQGPLTVAMYATWEPTHYAVRAITKCLDQLEEFCYQHLPA